MGCCGNCCSSLRLFILRTLNFALLVLGMALLVWGVVLCAKHQNVSLVSGSVLGAGLLMALLSGSLVFCAYQSVCFLTLYIACMSVLMLAELVLGIVYLIPSTRKEIVDAMKDETGKTISNDTVVIAGYVLLGAVVVKFVSVVFAACHRKVAGRAPADESPFIPDRGMELHQGDSKSAAARERIQQKYAHLYDRYGIKPGSSSGGMRRDLEAGHR